MRRQGERWNRREFLSGLTLAGTAAVLGARLPPAAAEPRLETERLRLLHRPSLCEAPEYVAEELLRGEGFRDVQYVKAPLMGLGEKVLASGEADVSTLFGPSSIYQVDAGAAIVFLAGLHVGCTELIANERVRTIRDLKGKTVAHLGFGGSTHVLPAIVASYVGLNPERDLKWAVHPIADWGRLLTAGKVDAFLGFPPLAQELRAKKVGHVLLNTLTDRPWSQYVCCMVAANKDFARANPVATKRAVRAILKASDLCAAEPERVARFLVDKGYAERSDYVVQSMKEVAYGTWRSYDAEDALRFYALRLHEVGLIKSSPQKILAESTDWRFLRELKKELKA